MSAVGVERGVLQGSPVTLGAAISAAADQFGDREAFVDGEERLSYAEWGRRASGVAAVLAERGVRPGDVVCLMLPSSIDFAICYAGAAMAGVVVTAVNTRLGPVEVAGILDRCTPALVIGSGSDRPAVPVSFDGLLMARDELPAHYAAAPLAEPVAVAPDAPAVIVWTSGTTGLPKGAWFDHTGLAAAATVSGVLSAPGDRRLMASPMAHAAFMTRVWDQVAWGMTVVLSPTPWTADSMLELLVEERITVGQGVPTQWEKLLALPAFDAADLSALRICATGATRVPRELVRRMRRRLPCPVVVRYAATETPAISGTRPEDPLEVLERTVGRGLDGVRVKVVADDLRDAGPGEVGRVAISSPFRMRGYWQDEEQTAAALTEDGWLISSDLGRLDPAGNLVLVGRASEVYIRGGFNVYPLEVENVLSTHPAVHSAAVVGVPAPVIGEVGVAFVVASQPCTAAELQAWCLERIADYKVPDRVEFLDELPLNSMMKVEKAELARRAMHDAPV